MFVCRVRATRMLDCQL